MKNIFLFGLGFIIVIFGITLALRNWPAAVIVFQGIAPLLIAIAGLVLMFAASLKR